MKKMRKERGGAVGCGGCLGPLRGAMSRKLEKGRTAKGEEGGGLKMFLRCIISHGLTCRPSHPYS